MVDDIDISEFHNHNYMDIDVANISFGYANRKLISLLKKRGKGFNNSNFSDIKRYETEINQYVK